MNRLRAGYFVFFNPYNQQPLRVDLRTLSVYGVVFWSKKPTPFISRLTEVRERGYPFIVKYSVDSYPRALETSVVDAVRTVEQLVHLAITYGA